MLLDTLSTIASRRALYQVASMFAVSTIFVVGLVSMAGSANGEPIYPNSVVSNSIDFIRSDDPTIGCEIIELGRARREMPGSLESESLFQDRAYVLDLRFVDGASVALWADEHFEDLDAVLGYAKKVSDPLGKLPKPLRESLKRVVVHRGDRVASSEHEGRFFMLYAENIDARISTEDLEETVFHETIHATLELGHATSDAWLEAQRADGDFITTYAESRPAQEDLPESALFAYTLIRYPGRMPGEVEAAVKRIMPNRLAYLRAVFTDLETAVKKRPNDG